MLYIPDIKSTRGHKKSSEHHYSISVRLVVNMPMDIILRRWIT